MRSSQKFVLVSYKESSLSSTVASAGAAAGCVLMRPRKVALAAQVCDVRCRFPDGHRFRQDVQRVHTQRTAGHHPPRDYGKTTGVIVLLNNATRPLAGLLVGLFSGPGRVALVVTLTSIGMAILGGVVVAMGPLEPDRLHAFRTDA